MLNILHLTDLHYSDRSEYEQSMVLGALLKDISDNFTGRLQPDLLIFSGDLVNKADDREVFSKFYDEILEPIMKVSRCGDARVILTPGNHDTHKDYVLTNRTLQEAWLAELVDRETANAAFLDRRIDDFVSGKFSAYRELRDYLGYAHVLYRSALSSARDYPEIGCSVVQVNTSWMGYAGVDKIRDERKLVVPEAAVELALRCVPENRVVVLVTHHPLNWLKEFSESDVIRTIEGRVHLHVYGHMHESQPQSVTGLKGERLSVQGGALFQGNRKRYIGYSFIRVDQETGHKEVQLRSYFDTPREFGPAVDLSPKKQGRVYSSAAAESFFRKNGFTVDRRVLNQWLHTEVRPDILKSFDDGLTDRPLSTIFVAPPLFTSKYETPTDAAVPQLSEEPLDFAAVSDGNENYVLVGGNEYGKTTLLRQIALRQAECSSQDRPIVPVVINFNAIKRGENRIEALIRATLPDMPDGCQLNYLLAEGFLAVLVDDVIFSDAERLGVLERFIETYNKNRFVFTVQSTKNDRFLASGTFDLPVHFTRVNIQPLRRKDLRVLVAKWDVDGKLDKDKILDRLITSMKGINVPITAVNGTILLSIYDTQSNFTPINRSSLIEYFIDSLLDKHRPQNARSKTFDYTNRVDMLSYISGYMVDNNRYVLPSSELQDVAASYMKKFGLNYDSKIIVDEFIDTRILHHRIDGNVSFRYRAFLEYFVAKRMIVDAAFRAWVMEPERYMGFVNEIGYYSGLVRNDQEILEIVGQRMEALSAQVFQREPDVRLLEQFVLPKEADTSDLMLESIEEQINAPPLTPEERDEILDADLPQDVEGRQEVFRPAPKDDPTKWFTALVIYSSLIRNSEMVPDAVKRRHLTAVIRQWGSMFMSSLWAVPQIAKSRAIRVNGVMFRVAVPSHYSEGQVARIIYCDLPNAISKLVLQFLGSEKLEQQLIEPELDEAGEPRFLTFIRNCLLADLRLGDWQERMRRYADDIHKNRYLLEALVWKMNETLRLGALDEKPRDHVAGILARAIGGLKGGTKEDREKIANREMRRFKTLEYVRKLTAKEDE